MKKIFILSCLFVAISVTAQTTASYHLTSRNNAGILSKKSDTLYLIDDQLGYVIKQSWYLKDSTGRELYPVRPHFVFIPKDKLVQKLDHQILAESKKQKLTGK
jgi:hypothetical protein